jgi:hypothetical protein
MKEATDAGDYDRLEPLAKIWGRLTHPTCAKASHKWNAFTMAELRRIHAVLTNRGEETLDEAGAEGDLDPGDSTAGAGGVEEGSWVRRALSRDLVLSHLDASPVPIRHQSGAGSNDLRRAITFERQSIGQELAIAVALGILPGGVEAIQGRKGAQATQGTPAPNVRTFVGE